MELREAKNRVIIRGYLSEIGLAAKSYTDKKTGEPVEYIGGEIKVRAKTKIHDVEKELEIPVRLFAKKLTKDGAISKLYTSYENVMQNFVSIAAGGIENANYIEVSGSIKMNEYVGRTGKFVSFVTVDGKFVSIADKSKAPCAYCDLEVFYADSMEEMDVDGTPTGRLQLITVVPTWGNHVEVVPLFCQKDSIIDGISQYWETNETYPVHCELDFTSTSRTESIEQGIGEPIEKVIVEKVSDLILTSTVQVPLQEPLKYDAAAIQEALNARSADIEKKKAAKSAAPAPKKMNLGF